ncbi:hypothetical protein VE03_02954 [Pseudogymnoascus sp. 23342-1-I1]|nr:hypothetical protein VE03_02954 [Pseudogymnoascus sp. 23342-1-I1]
MSSTLSTMSSSTTALLLPTLTTNPSTTHPLTTSSSLDPPSIQTITFGILSAVLALGSIILAYLQLARMRRERLKAQNDCEMQATASSATTPLPLGTEYFFGRSVSSFIELPSSVAELPGARVAEARVEEVPPPYMR